MGLTNSPLCRRCEAEKQTSAHILCESEAVASLRHACLGSCFLEPEDVKSLVLGAIWNTNTETGLPWLDIRLKGTKGPSKGLATSGRKGSNPVTDLILSNLAERNLFAST